MKENGKPENAMPKNAMDEPVLVYATFPGEEDAARAGRILVGHGLAACVNILPGMTSIYRWQGSVQEAAEAVMVIKTRRGLADAVVSTVRAGHAYKNPALLMLPVIGGSADFIRWIQFETTEGASRAPLTSFPEDE